MDGDPAGSDASAAAQTADSVIFRRSPAGIRRKLKLGPEARSSVDAVEGESPRGSPRRRRAWLSRCSMVRGPMIAASPPGGGLTKPMARWHEASMPASSALVSASRHRACAG